MVFLFFELERDFTLWEASGESFLKLYNREYYLIIFVDLMDEPEEVVLMYVNIAPRDIGSVGLNELG